MMAQILRCQRHAGDFFAASMEFPAVFNRERKTDSEALVFISPPGVRARGLDFQRTQFPEAYVVPLFPSFPWKQTDRNIILITDTAYDKKKYSTVGDLSSKEKI